MADAVHGSRESRNICEFIIATGGVAGALAAIGLGVHFLFADSAIAALVGFACRLCWRWG